jgi:hypothetical protein
MNKPHWYATFERQQLNRAQMERQKFEEELRAFVEPKDQLTRGTRSPNSDELLKLAAHFNTNKKHLWL